MDSIVGLPQSEGHDAFLVVVDRLTKERHYIPCTATDESTSAEYTAEMRVNEVFRVHGLPASIVSDRGPVPQFVATVWKSFCKRLGVTAKLCTVFHPQTDGQTERSNQDPERHLRIYCNYMQDDRAKWISKAEFADNDGVSSSTGVTLFYATKGFLPCTSFSNDSTSYENTRKRVDAARAENIAGNMQKVLEYIRGNMDRSQRAMVAQKNQQRLDVKFKEGDWVFLSSKNFTSTHPCKKLDDKKHGPFKIKALVGSSYRLDLPKAMRIHDVLHAKLLSLATTDPLLGQKNSPPPGANDG